MPFTSALAIEPAGGRVAVLRSSLEAQLQLREEKKPLSVKVLGGIIESDEFGGLTTREQYLALLVGGKTALDAKQYWLSQRWLRRSCDSPHVGATDWDLRMIASYNLRDLKDAALSLTTLAERWPKDLVEMRSRAASLVARDASPREIDDKARLRLLNALHKANFKFDSGETPERLWFELVWIQLSLNDIERARQVAATLLEPRVIITMWADRRFDGATRATNEPPDIASYSGRWVARAKQASDENPQSLAARLHLCQAYVVVGRFDDALALVGSTLEQIRVGSREPPFADTQEKLIDLEECRLDVYKDLGQWEKIEPFLLSHAQRPEAGRPALPHQLALALFHVEFSRGAEALQILDHIEPGAEFSPDQRAYYQAIEHAAALQTNNPQRAEKVRAAMKRSEDPHHWYLNVLLDANDMDGAAAEVIRRLNHPYLRTPELYSLQTFRKPAAETPHSSLWAERFEALKQRPDVRAAINKVGRTASFDITRE